MRRDRPAQADADLGEVLRRRVRRRRRRLLHAEAAEHVRRAAVVRADLVDQRAAEAAIDADVRRAVDVVRRLAELALDEQAAVARRRRPSRPTSLESFLLSPFASDVLDAAGEQADAELRQLGARRVHRGDAGTAVRLDRVVARAVVRRHVPAGSNSSSRAGSSTGSSRRRRCGRRRPSVRGRRSRRSTAATSGTRRADVDAAADQHAAAEVRRRRRTDAAAEVGVTCFRGAMDVRRREHRREEVGDGSRGLPFWTSWDARASRVGLFCTRRASSIQGSLRDETLGIPVLTCRRRDLQV